MDERMYGNYTKEEEFLNEFGYGGIVEAVAKAIAPAEWRPDYECNDCARGQRKYFISTGQQSQLTFDFAAVYRTPYGFSSAQITLSSSAGSITVRVAKVGDEYEGKVIHEHNATR